jgi:2-oxoisovalerate dehydrogenase E1 component
MIRLFEETLLDLFSKGRLSGTVHTCIGQELSGLAVMRHIREGDWIFSNHRCHGHYLAWKEDVRGLLAEIMGKRSGICAGRGGSQHICSGRFLSNGVQGGGVPIATGCALALANDPQGKAIAVAFIGDGTLGQGVVYESLNLAKKWDVPLLIVLEHNGYAQSTDTARTIAGDIRQRFESFGLKYWEGAIWDNTKLFAAAEQAVEHVRNERTPGALCITCYRLKAHSKGDDNRDPNEITSYLQRDPLVVFEKHQPEVAQRIRQECQKRIDDVIAELDHESSGAAGATQVPGWPTGRAAGWKAVEPLAQPQRVVERVRAGLKKLLGDDNRVVLLGEDMEDPYGGAFKASKGLSTEFPGRVRNTPISEAAITGVGNGLALAGLRPFVEIMFGDFITLAADQLINQASKFAYMYNEQVSVPVVVRTPMGGKRGYGATHSQSLEKHFLGTPGLTVAAMNSVFDPALLLGRIHTHLRSPCLLIENKLLYSMPVHHQAVDGRQWVENGAAFPTLKLEAAGSPDVTIVAYGGMVEEVEEAVNRAFLEQEIMAEVLAPTMIYPLDIDPIVESVQKTKRLLVVEEGQGFAGFGAEVISLCAEKLRGVNFQVARVCAATHAIPCCREQEKDALPGATSVLNAICSLARS